MDDETKKTDIPMNLTEPEIHQLVDIVLDNRHTVEARQALEGLLLAAFRIRMGWGTTEQ